MINTIKILIPDLSGVKINENGRYYTSYDVRIDSAQLVEKTISVDSFLKPFTENVIDYSPEVDDSVARVRFAMKINGNIEEYIIDLPSLLANDYIKAGECGKDQLISGIKQSILTTIYIHYLCSVLNTDVNKTIINIGQYEIGRPIIKIFKTNNTIDPLTYSEDSPILSTNLLSGSIIPLMGKYGSRYYSMNNTKELFEVIKNLDLSIPLEYIQLSAFPERVVFTMKKHKITTKFQSDTNEETYNMVSYNKQDRITHAEGNAQFMNMLNFISSISTDLSGVNHFEEKYNKVMKNIQKYIPTEQAEQIYSFILETFGKKVSVSSIMTNTFEIVDLNSAVSMSYDDVISKLFMSFDDYIQINQLTNYGLRYYVHKDIISSCTLEKSTSSYIEANIVYQYLSAVPGKLKSKVLFPAHRGQISGIIETLKSYISEEEYLMLKLLYI